MFKKFSKSPLFYIFRHYAIFVLSILFFLISLYCKLIHNSQAFNNRIHFYKLSCVQYIFVEVLKDLGITKMTCWPKASYLSRNIISSLSMLDQSLLSKWFALVRICDGASFLLIYLFFFDSPVLLITRIT